MLRQWLPVLASAVIFMNVLLVSVGVIDMPLMDVVWLSLTIVVVVSFLRMVSASNTAYAAMEQRYKEEKQRNRTLSIALHNSNLEDERLRNIALAFLRESAQAEDEKPSKNPADDGRA